MKEFATIFIFVDNPLLISPPFRMDFYGSTPYINSYEFGEYIVRLLLTPYINSLVNQFTKGRTLPYDSFNAEISLFLSIIVSKEYHMTTASCTRNLSSTCTILPMQTYRLDSISGEATSTISF